MPPVVKVQAESEQQDLVCMSLSESVTGMLLGFSGSGQIAQFKGCTREIVVKQERLLYPGALGSHIRNLLVTLQAVT